MPNLSFAQASAAEGSAAADNVDDNVSCAKIVVQLPIVEYKTGIKSLLIVPV